MLPKARHIVAMIAIIIGAFATFYTGFADSLRLAIMIASFSVLVLVFALSLIDEAEGTEAPIEMDWKKPLDEIR